jgi:hypothetical protein
MNGMYFFGNTIFNRILIPGLKGKGGKSSVLQGQPIFLRRQGGFKL